MQKYHLPSQLWAEHSQQLYENQENLNTTVSAGGVWFWEISLVLSGMA